jgi:hypothetical protein
MVDGDTNRQISALSNASNQVANGVNKAART